jgi:hypothetical protein
MARKFSLLLALASIAASACTARGSGSDGSAASAAGLEPAMMGTLYEPGRTFAQTYCSPCHWKGGQHAKHRAAYPAFQIDTYEEWALGKTIIPAVLDKWKPDGKVMPPPEAPADPPDDARMLILDWVRRGSPNTPDGR